MVAFVMQSMATQGAGAGGIGGIGGAGKEFNFPVEASVNSNLSGLQAMSSTFVGGGGVSLQNQPTKNNGH